MTASQAIYERIEAIRSDLITLTGALSAQEAKLTSQKEELAFCKERLRCGDNCEQIAAIKARLDGMDSAIDARLDGMNSYIAALSGGSDRRLVVGKPVVEANRRPALDQ